MLKINDKIFMNLQEAVQWLLDNNALPFQSSANYIANTEIGLGTIVNPSPAKVRIGSLIFFADSKVSTVTGLTENGFIVSDQYNDLVDDVVYVSNVALNASGHLIVTLSNGDSIDAGLIKQVSGFSIDGSQHLIVSYNDGTSSDLGAIFNGNITISGTLSIVGGISGNLIVSGKAKILENITDANEHYRFVEGDGVVNSSFTGFTSAYCKWSLSGTHLMMVLAGTFANGAVIPSVLDLAVFNLPQWIYDKIYPVWSAYLEDKLITMYNNSWGQQTVDVALLKDAGAMKFRFLGGPTTLTDDRSFRVQFDLLIDNA